MFVFSVFIFVFAFVFVLSILLMFLSSFSFSFLHSFIMNMFIFCFFILFYFYMVGLESLSSSTLRCAIFFLLLPSSSLTRFFNFISCFFNFSNKVAKSNEDKSLYSYIAVTSCCQLWFRMKHLKTF